MYLINSILINADINLSMEMFTKNIIKNMEKGLLIFFSKVFLPKKIIPTILFLLYKKNKNEKSNTT